MTVDTFISMGVRNTGLWVYTREDLRDLTSSFSRRGRNLRPGEIKQCTQATQLVISALGTRRVAEALVSHVVGAGERHVACG